MVLVGEILLIVLEIFFWIIIAQVALSWLIAFDVINIRNPQAAHAVRLINKATDWVYVPLRKVIPAIGGIDITPIIVIFAISILKQLIYSYLIYA